MLRPLRRRGIEPEDVRGPGQRSGVTVEDRADEGPVAAAAHRVTECIALDAVRREDLVHGAVGQPAPEAGDGGGGLVDGEAVVGGVGLIEGDPGGLPVDVDGRVGEVRGAHAGRVGHHRAPLGTAVAEEAMSDGVQVQPPNAAAAAVAGRMAAAHVVPHLVGENQTAGRGRPVGHAEHEALAGR